MPSTLWERARTVWTNAYFVDYRRTPPKLSDVLLSDVHSCADQPTKKSVRPPSNQTRHDYTNATDSTDPIYILHAIHTRFFPSKRCRRPFPGVEPDHLHVTHFYATQLSLKRSLESPVCLTCSGRTSIASRDHRRGPYLRRIGGMAVVPISQQETTVRREPMRILKSPRWRKDP